MITSEIVKVPLSNNSSFNYRNGNKQKVSSPSVGDDANEKCIIANGIQFSEK